MKRSELIKKFLELKTHPDLAALYHKGMECQVNVSKDNGERVEAGNLENASWIEWTDGIESWKNFRIPLKAMSDPQDNDCEMSFNESHIEGIGMTGWNWQTRQSIYVTYDFDAMVGHSDKHAKKLSDKELIELQDVITKLPFVTLRKSTSGKGLHLYIFLNTPVETKNHGEHAALARALLSMFAGQTGFSFTDKVDICGGNMWVWHRKMTGTDGLKIIKQGSPLPNDMIPPNWKDHTGVVTKQVSRIPNYKLDDDPKSHDLFDQLTSQRSKIKLDEDHKKLINFLSDRRLKHFWNPDAHMLVTHTAYLKDAHTALEFRGKFFTLAEGKDYGSDHNCFMFPCPNGAWAVRRYGPGTPEHKFWKQDPKGWTRCYFNRDLTLEEIARIYDAIELENKGYQFKTCANGMEAMKELNIIIELPEWIQLRCMKVKEGANNKYVIYIPKEDVDNAQEMNGWAVTKTSYTRIYDNPNRRVEGESSVLGEYDSNLRHIVSEQGEDLGWVINTGSSEWRNEPIAHVKLLLKANGLGPKEIDIILGQSVHKAWICVNKPFQPEYPGDRQWNVSKARFRIPPTIEGENLSYPTWLKILDHCGKSLDSVIQNNQWCKDNGLRTGADYLRLWLACLIKYPQSPLPYLGFFGPQNSGKSTLHEAFCQLILDGGYARADTALTSNSAFNGELEGSVLNVIEETNVAANGRDKLAYNRLKDWVTSAQISIHKKGSTPYMVPNYTHWIQCANEREFIPIFSGDTRVTLLYVDSIPKENLIPKRDLWILLTKEAPDFLAGLLSTDVPDSKDRLMLPVLNTVEKEEAEYSNMNPVERFFKDCIFNIDGAYISSKELYKAFCDYLDPVEAMGWNPNKFARCIPKSYIKGRLSATKTQDTYYANISLNSNDKVGKKWSALGMWLKQIGD